MKIFYKKNIINTKISILFSAIITTSSSAHPYETQEKICVEHYKFDIELIDDSDEINANTTVRVRFLSDHDKAITLDLKSRAEDGTGMRVSSVVDVVSARPVTYFHTGDKLLVVLDTAPAAGEVRTFRISYAGKPQDGLLFGTSRYGGRVVVSWNWPAKMRNWAPSIDHPSSKATSEWAVTAPEQYSVVANGLLDSETSLGDGRKTTRWKQNVAIPVWLNAIQVARFQTWHGGTARGVPLQIWAPAGAKVDVDNGFLVGRRAIDFFGDVVGPYPYEKLAQVVAPLAYWSMENASVVFYGDAGTRNGQEPMTRRPMPDVAMTSAPLMVHEIAHQWFGDSVTEKRWGDVWLSESFATYFADLYTEHYDGRDAFTASLRKEREKALAAEQTEKDPVISSADDSAGPDLSHIQYVKGGWILHMLREEIGAANFFKGIRLYYQRYRDSHATTADLRNAMEEASGSKLGGFFDQWLTRIDSPKLRVRWDYDAAKQMLNLSVEQEQPGPAYRIPIEFGTADEPRGTLSISKVTMDQKNQTFALPLARRPVDVVIDPATKLLAHMRIEPR